MTVHQLVAWSRLGSGYSPAELRAARESRALLELRAMLRPGEGLARWLALDLRWPSPRR